MSNNITTTSIMDTIRAQIGTPAELLQQYCGLIPKHGMVCCPIHSDKTPSMKVDDRRVKCFGCGWSGDSIDLYAKFNNLSIRETIKQLSSQAGVTSEEWNKQTEEAKKKQQIKEAVYQDAEACCRSLRLRRFLMLRLLRFARPLMETKDGLEVLKEMIDKLNAIDEVLPVFYSGSKVQDLHGLRAARRAGLWG